MSSGNRQPRARRNHPAHFIIGNIDQRILRNRGRAAQLMADEQNGGNEHPDHENHVVDDEVPHLPDNGALHAQDNRPAPTAAPLNADIQALVQQVQEALRAQQQFFLQQQQQLFALQQQIGQAPAGQSQNELAQALARIMQRNPVKRQFKVGKPFDGHDRTLLEGFLKTLRDQRAQYEMSDHDSLSSLSSVLGGEALKWLVAQGEAINDWATFERLFTNAFGDNKHDGTWLYEMTHDRQASTETVATYLQLPREPTEDQSTSRAQNQCGIPRA